MNLSLLQHIPKNFEIETTVNPARINIANTKKQKDGYIVYICERELRYHDNFAIKYANRAAILQYLQYFYFQFQ